MAQTGYTPISIYYSSTATNVPTAGNLVAGELAINTADGKLFYKDSSGVVQTIASKNGVAGGSTTQVQYNSSGSLAGSANMTFSGTALTLANDASISGLTVGKGNGALTQNTAFGVTALAATTGAYNTAVGYRSLLTNTSGVDNNAFGQASLQLNTTGSQNLGMGSGALYSNTTGSNNTGLGYQALLSNTTASNNTAVGYQAGYSNTTGQLNTAMGGTSMYACTTGSENTAYGEQSLKSLTTANANVAIGRLALQANTTGANNAALGYQALQANTTASNNTAVGYQALYTNTTASGNTAVGYKALYSANRTADENGLNTAIGYNAGYSQTTGQFNVYIGRDCGYSSTGSEGTFVGHTSGYYTTGSQNTLIGKQAGYLITSGAKNTVLGSFSGNQGGVDIRTASNHIVISDGDGNPKIWMNSSSVLYVAGIYSNTSANSANVVVYGANGDLYRSTSALKYKQDVRDLPTIDINKFRPIVYKSKCTNDDQTIDHFGIIADEVDEAGIKELVNYGDNGEVENFKYDRLTVVLLKAIQELKAEFDAYKATHP